MHTALILAQAQPPAGGGNASGTASWLTFVLLLAAVGVMSKFGNTVIKILSIAMSMGAVGIFLTLVHVPFIDQVNTAVSGWLSVGNTSFTPILMIAISIGIRAAQVFQQANETVGKVLEKIPDPIEYGVVILAAVVGGLAMAGTPAWTDWFNQIATLITQIWNFGLSTFNLFGGFINPGAAGA